MTEVRNGFQPTQPKPTIQTIPKVEGANGQCKSCIHSCVCAYKGHYEDAVELYEKAKNECGKYPYFVCEIRCIKYLKKVETHEITAEMNLKSVIAESREVAQALNDFADSLERIEKKYKDAERSGEE